MALICAEKEPQLFTNMKYLPAVIIDIIKEYVPNIVYMFLNRENYVKYHHLFLKYISNKNMEQYIRQTVRQDHAFVFNLILVENFVWWIKMKKYLYRDCIYANYLLFLKSYALEYDSLECNNLISRLLTNLGLSKNQHKKNIVRNIRWKN